MRSAVVVACSVLNVAIELMNHFPLFALLLRMKDPRRLPGPYFYLNRPVYPCPSRIKVNDSGTGSTYFRVVNRNGHPMLVLEVTSHISTSQGFINLFNSNGIDTNSVILDTFRAIRIVTSRPGSAMGILKVGFDLM